MQAAEPIETIAQFLEWYGREEDRLAEGQDQEAHAYAELLRQRASQCSSMLCTIGDIEGQLARMESGYQAACEQTQSVQQACADLGVRRDQLMLTTSQVQAHLSVYNTLGRISQLLNSPGDRVCLDPEFLPSLTRTEEAIAFINAHSATARDSELFLMRFAQCRMRALSLIKMHALRVFKQLGADIGHAFEKNPSVGSSSRSAALYVRFRASATHLAPLLRALHERAGVAEAGSTEQQVLLDVQNAYFHARRAWLRPYIDDRLKAIAREHEQASDSTLPSVHVDSLRDWCAFMMNVCADEYRIYYDFFSGSADTVAGSSFAMSPALRAYLDSLMTIFHEHVRPIVIHESDVAVLAGLSLTLLTYHNPGNSEVSDSDNDDSSSVVSSRKSISYAPVDSELDAFYAVVDQILRDTQQRLVYKAQSFIRANISSYKVSKDDGAAVARWVQLCLRLRITDPEELVTLVAQASITVDMQQQQQQQQRQQQQRQQQGGDSDRLSSTGASSSFVDVTTAALGGGTAAADITGEPSETTARSTSSIAGLLKRMPGGHMATDDIDALRWIYPPVKSYRWLVSQIDGCIDFDVQQSVLDEALTACKQNLLNQGARFVREASSKDSQSPTPANDDIHADQLAHLFVTYNLNSIEHVFD
ncbi:Golgi transport complex subunit 3 [Coemansia sp. RSA 1813]|nr:Golgi transport complex subunit 3 [Coemansia sp. RSA 487]KAJ2567082.1 Golgi transport complex subunit 3 [Coemansia sp. RSA 1813]